MSIHVARNIIVEKAGTTPADARRVELAERKGMGHPDTICDSVMEAVCISLCQEYLALTGQILHHNIDKGLLVAGRSAVKPGGGTLLEPMKLIFGDRATSLYQGVKIPVAEIAEAAASRWLKNNLRFVDPARHIIFQNEIKPGSAELTDLFSRTIVGANDTSVGVGYAPLSTTESLVLKIEHHLNSPAFKLEFPETGEDVKVMAFRDRDCLTLTIAVAFVDRFIADTATYFRRKDAVREALLAFVAAQGHPFKTVTIELNMLDDPSRGEGGIYLTVLGTSAEGADGGEVGRGNRVNGLIAFQRPLSLEAAAGKNPARHVGKIYNVLARETAERIYREVEGVAEVSLFLCSQIGQPIDWPLSASVQIIPADGVAINDLRVPVAAIIDAELADIGHFTERLARGEFSIC
jgi:S-adenosylmethionine synthetase